MLKNTNHAINSMAILSRLDEEQLISRYFRRSKDCPDLDLGIGDDAAVIRSGNERLAITTDTLVEGVHFDVGSDAHCLGHKALAVNLSDLAAMGAEPRWALLALTMPKVDTNWLAAFCDGFFRLADCHKVDLIGGDTTRGALTITVQLIGTLAEERALCRHKAQVGDGIYVTGRIADSALAALFADTLKAYKQSYEQCTARLMRPTARVAEGIILARYATAAIDISDGILKDLSRILSASDVGAEIEIDDIPTIPEIEQCCPTLELLLKALIYGEDYELLFTLKDEYIAAVKQAFAASATPFTRIGTIDETRVLKCYWQSKPVVLPERLGYDHFT